MAEFASLIMIRKLFSRLEEEEEEYFKLDKRVTVTIL